LKTLLRKKSNELKLIKTVNDDNEVAVLNQIIVERNKEIKECKQQLDLLHKDKLRSRTTMENSLKELNEKLNYNKFLVCS